MHSQFPNVRPVQAHFRSTLKGAITILPSTPVPWQAIGRAIDYRLRYYFAVTPAENLVAYHGMLTVSEGPSGVRLLSSLGDFGAEPRWPYLGQSFFGSLQQILDRINPVQRRLGQEDERTINRYCMVLAYFEEIYRTGQVGSLLDQLPKDARAEDALELVRGDWVDDLCAISHAFWDSHEELTVRQATLNPTFAGSNDVGGADADLIVDGCLIDVKTTKNPSLDAKWLYQVIGYTLLDYENQYDVQSVGFYLARQATLITWPIEELLEMVSGGKRLPLAHWRDIFQAQFRLRRVRGDKTSFYATDRQRAFTVQCCCQSWSSCMFVIGTVDSAAKY